MIEIPIPSLLSYLLEVLTEIFFIFQYISMAVWILEGFVMFAAVMIIASIAITLINYLLLRHSLLKLKKFAEINLYINVYRSGKKQKINCKELLPGDVFEFENKMAIPCDSLLL
jgi:magnesium-transporting ATPase (P-type)